MLRGGCIACYRVPFNLGYLVNLIEQSSGAIGGNLFSKAFLPGSSRETNTRRFLRLACGRKRGDPRDQQHCTPDIQRQAPGQDPLLTEIHKLSDIWLMDNLTSLFQEI
ncbi:hypothetical protein SprV_0100200500 [Sparganum proliferum]